MYEIRASFTTRSVIIQERSREGNPSHYLAREDMLLNAEMEELTKVLAKKQSVWLNKSPLLVS